MNFFRELSLVILLSGLPGGAADGQPPPAKPQVKTTPESRALAFLAREVPLWSAENKCYSCHNNGDAARALYTAVRLSYSVPAKALEDTSRWLAAPKRWDRQGGDAPFKDKKLAGLQFAGALVDAVDAGFVKDRKALARAAEMIASYQQKDGSWQVDAAENLGSPATYGTCLATVQACHILRKADPQLYRKAIARAGQWLRQVRVRSVLDAAAVLLSLEDSKTDDILAQRRHCLELIRKGQSKEGGWGPYVNAPSEPFDTAVVLLALVRQPDTREVQPMIQRGRAFLIAEQRTEGDWPPTTRPPGAESYAQRLSTTGWATLALLATHDPLKPR
jgi:hypothetical protein